MPYRTHRVELEKTDPLRKPMACREVGTASMQGKLRRIAQDSWAEGEAKHHEALYLLAVAGDVSGAHRARTEGVKYEAVYVDLDAGQQRQADYKSVNPQMVLPSLVEDDGNVLTQSLAVLVFLSRSIPSRRCCRRTRGAGRGYGHCRRSRSPNSHPLIVPRVRNSHGSHLRSPTRRR